MSVSRKDLKPFLLVILAAAAFTYALMLFKPVGTPIDRTPVVNAVFDDPEAPRSAPANADVTMAIFTDYQCPACRDSNLAMRRAVSEDERVTVIYKDWPVFGERSRVAARVAIASDMQGIYPEVHDRLMRRTGPLDGLAMRAAIEAAGGDWPRLMEDLGRNRARIDALIARNEAQAFSLGLGGTPGYLIGPILVRGALDEREFRKAISEARDAGEPPPK